MFFNQASIQSQNIDLNINEISKTFTTSQNNTFNIVALHYIRNFNEIRIDDDTFEVTSQFKQQPFAKVVKVNETQIEFNNNDVEELSSVQENDFNNQIKSSRLFINAQRMTIEYIFIIFDINYKF